MLNKKLTILIPQEAIPPAKVPNPGNNLKIFSNI